MDATQAPAPPSVRISSGSDRVTVIAEDREEVTVEGPAAVQFTEHVTTVSDVRGALVVRVPVGTSVVVGASSGRVDVKGQAGDVAVTTESGRITIAHAARVDARSSSARVEVGVADGPCRIRTESGRISVESCAGADVATESGRVELRHVDGPVHAHCVTGRIVLEMDAAHDIRAETVSGRIDVSLPAGVTVHESVASASAEPPADCDCTVAVRSVTGKVAVAHR